MTRLPSSRSFVSRASLGLVVAVVGCGRAAPPPAAVPRAETGHDHVHEDKHSHDEGHEHGTLETFAAAVAKLRGLGDEVAEKLKGDAVADADGAVHEIGHLLEEARALAKQEGLEGAATAALDELEDCFGKVDEAFHSGAEKADLGAVLESVKERLEAAFAKLKEVK